MIAPNIATAIAKEAPTESAMIGRVIRCIGSSGSSTRVSMITKAISSTAATAYIPMITGEPQAKSLPPQVVASRPMTRPGVRVAMPSRSTFPRCAARGRWR